MHKYNDKKHAKANYRTCFICIIQRHPKHQSTGFQKTDSSYRLYFSEEPFRRAVHALTLQKTETQTNSKNDENLRKTFARLRNGSRGAVKVYPVTEIGMTEYGGDTTETSGTVTMDKLQKVYLSKTQSSAQVYVTEGQTVKKGDRLLSYDSTLTELDVERARIALERLRLQQENTRKELQQLQLAEDKEKLQQQADALSAKIEKKLADSTGEIIRRDSKPIQPGKPLLRGSAAGTAEDPLYCDWNSGDALTEQNLSVLLPEGEKELYVVLVTHRGDETLGDIIGSWGLHLIRGENGAISVSLAELPAAEDISVDGTTDEIRQLRKELQRVQELLSRSYTKAELLRMQNDKLREIQEADTSIKMAELDLRKKQTEASDGSVYSQLDGVVKAVRTPTDAAANNEAVVEVSAGGGYYVTGTVSELRLDTVKVGQTVNISSRMTGAACTGEVVEISTYPTDGDSHGGDGNPNVSYYPFKVFVSEDQQLQEGESVSISYQAVSDSDGSSLYLENMYVRTENGKSYVMARGENGKLEQRWVQTGKVVWDSYTQIRGGLTQEDYVAFPYGRDVVSGAKTEEATVDALHSW